MQIVESGYRDAFPDIIFPSAQEMLGSGSGRCIVTEQGKRTAQQGSAEAPGRKETGSGKDPLSAQGAAQESYNLSGNLGRNDIFCSPKLFGEKRCIPDL